MVINGQIFYGMMISAANALDNNKVTINNMNVFPVPDGDTGINMTMTLSTVRALRDFDGTIADCADKVAGVILRSARGNSGAILSLFFRGVSKAFRGLEVADATDVAHAFTKGTEEAYKAVMKPTEGTILTVMRETAESAEALAGEYAGNVEGLFKCLLKVAEESLARTPEQLPLLKEVHVVDAGGYGFVTVLSGMLAALRDDPVLLAEEGVTPTQADFSDFNTGDITFSYCTECIVEKKEEAKGEGTAEELRLLLSNIGDSVVFVDDERLIKLHVHTDHPGQVMEKALEYGSIASAKIENMRIQHSVLASGARTENSQVSSESNTGMAEEVKQILPPSKKYGFVAVCMGDGLVQVFEDLGVDRVIFGGQTMNPSTQDILDGINMTPAQIVYVLPNNKNIYLVALQAAKLLKDKKVVVLNTRSVPEGISAMIAFNPDGTEEENLGSMENAIGNVTTMSVTHAVRDTTIEGHKIVSGQMLGLVNGNIACIADSPLECVEKLTDSMKESSYITLLYGSDVNEEEAEKVRAMVEKKKPDSEVDLFYGGQPLYDYVISVE